METNIPWNMSVSRDLIMKAHPHHVNKSSNYVRPQTEPSIKELQNTQWSNPFL